MHIHRLNAALSASALIVTPLGAALQAAPAIAASSKKVMGTTVNMRWGTVRVAIYVQGKKITGVQAAYPTERARSASINKQAIPMLRSEVLKAQSANISAISGATDTSGAYKKSLAAAVRKAGV